MDSSSFSKDRQTFPDAELLPIGGGTCLCFRVRLYGRLHFLKQLKPELRTDPRYVAALRKEFETGYRLDHPHLVRYLSATDDSFLMDYVDGETLDKFIEHHPDFFMKKENTEKIVLQLLDVVGYLHQQQIVHLDLKPSNILITRIGHDVKLIDLGFSYTDSHTDTMGYTTGYAAPEQLDGSSLPDARTDIYAIGKVLQQLPCAKRYAKVIARCTATQPEERYQSVQELQNALHPKSKWWRIIAAACLALTLLVGGFLLWSRSTTPLVESQPQDSIETTPMPNPVVEDNKEVIEKKKEVKEERETSQQTTVVAPTPTATPAATQVQPTSPAPTKKMSTTELQKKLRSIMQPIYVSTLEPLTKLPYTDNEQRYSTAAESFKSQLRTLLHPLGEELIQSGAIGDYTFYHEWSNMELDYLNSTYEKMVKNEKE